MGLYRGYIQIVEKDNGNYYSVVGYIADIGIMENKMDTTIPKP